MDLLKKLCEIHAPSGEEEVLRNSLIDLLKQSIKLENKTKTLLWKRISRQFNFSFWKT